MNVDLDNLKYADLQKLAKEAGIRANLKCDKLRKTLQEHYEAKEKYSGNKRASSKTNEASRKSALSSSNTPVDKKPKRRRTFDKEESEFPPPHKAAKISRLDTQEIIQKMDATQDKNTMKKTLMDAINEKVAKRLQEDKGTTTAEDTKRAKDMKKNPATSKIPHFKRNDVKPNESKKTPGKKDWSAIHGKLFEKMDSLDVYVEKKKNRAAHLMKDWPTDKSKGKIHSTLKKYNEYQTPESIKDRVHKKSINAKSKLFPTPGSTVPFKPTVLSTKDMNTNFGAFNSPAFRFTGASKIAKPVVPKRKSPRLTSANPIAKQTSVKKPPLVAAQNISTSESKPSKKTFDLKASLSRPISWVPYTGKVQPIVQSKTASKIPTKMNGHSSISKPALKTLEERKKFKTPPVKNNRDVRRKQAAQSRADKQFAEQMKRRGIAV